MYINLFIYYTFYYLCIFIFHIFIFIFQSTVHEQNVMRNVETYANEVRLIQKLEEHNGAVNSVAFYGNNLLSSASGLVLRITKLTI